MLKRFSIPLRLSLPLMLLLLGGGLSLYGFLAEISYSYQRQETQAIASAKSQGQQMSTLLEYLLRTGNHQDNSIEGANLLISQMRSDIKVKFAVFMNDQNTILLSTGYEQKGQSLNKTNLASLSGLIANVKDSQTGQVILAQDKQSLSAIYPVLLPAKPGTIRSNTMGILIINYDLASEKQQAYHDALTRTLKMMAVVTGLCFLVWLWFYQTWATRASKLVSVSKSLATGNLRDRTNLQGNDELAQISHAFDQMADQIQLDTEQLQASQLELQQKAEELAQTLEKLQNTQSQLIQGEKMSSLGELVAGVAHEINNPVNFIYGNLSYAQDYINDLLGLIELYQQEYPQPSSAIIEEIEAIELDFLKEDLQKLLKSMCVGANRIQEIVKSLRIFSRLDESEVKEVDIHEGLDSTLMILHHRLKAKHDRPEIQVIKEYGQLPLVNCHAGQLNQVFMNILGNAIDALEDRDHQMTAAEIEANPAKITIKTELTATKEVQITMSDNGNGIPEDMRSRIFNPFFTTKAIGKGTGMGLAISYQIVTEKHNGQLTCVSTPDQGTSFMIQIPLQS